MSSSASTVEEIAFTKEAFAVLPISDLFAYVVIRLADLLNGRLGDVKAE